MELEGIVDAAEEFVSSARSLLEDGHNQLAYRELDSLHDLLLEQFVCLPEPEME